MLFGEKIHRYFYILGLFIMAASLSIGKFAVGVSLFTIGINWVVEGNFRAKFRLFNARRSIMVLMGILVLHLIGTIWADDQHAAWNDMRIKVPLLLVPFVIGTSEPLEKKIFEALLFVFTIAVFISTVVTLLIFHHVIPIQKPIHDQRDASILVPLIRLSLMCVMSIFLLARWFYRRKDVLPRVGAILLSAWFIWFMIHMQSLTGIFILLFAGPLLHIFMSFNYGKRKTAYLLTIVYTGLTITGFLMVRNIYVENFSVTLAKKGELPHYTARGTWYDHYYDWPYVENGKQVMIYMADAEIDSCWKLKSNVPLEKGLNPMRVTLYRYLTSKGLHKDAEGFSKLTDADIREIENGVTNYKDKERSSLERRLYQVCWEYYHWLHGANPSGNSVTMRMELYSTASHSIREHPWIGVGTGGQEFAFREIYKKEGSKLEEDFQWMHSHNQFLSIAVCLGLPGLIYFIFMLLYPPSAMKRWKSYLYLAFFFIITFSMLDDDTLETNQGVVFFAFFNAILLYAMPRKSAINTEYQVRKEDQIAGSAN